MIKTLMFVCAITVLCSGCTELAGAIGQARADLKRDGSYLYIEENRRHEELIRTIKKEP